MSEKVSFMALFFICKKEDVCMNKMFFFDIDGTLIDCVKGIFEIPQEVTEAFDQLKKSGHAVFIATGRCKSFIVDGVMKYRFSGYVTCNGACVEYLGRIIYKKVIPTNAIKKTHQFCLEHNCAYYFENSDFIYVLNKNNPKHLEFKKEWGMKDEIIVDEFQIEDIETYIGMIVLNDESEVPLLLQELGDDFDIQRHVSGLSFDLTLKGESKAKGIKKLVEALSQDISQTVAFGDARNDIEMLSQVGLGIAMGNGSPEAKEIAQYITTDIDKGGIVNALKHFHFI